MALVRDLVGYAPAVIVPRLLMLAQVTLLTRFIPQAEFGRLVLVMTVGDACDALCCNWIRTVLARFGAGRDETLPEEAALSLMLYALFACGLALPVLYVGLRWFQPSGAGPFFLCVSGYMLTNGIVRNALTLLALQGLRLSFFLVEAVRTGVGFVAVMGLAITGVATSYVPLAAVINGATALAAVIGLALALGRIGLRWPTDWGWERRGYAMPLFAGAIIGILLNQSDRMVAEAFAGPVALATYAAAVTLARQPLEFIFSVINVRTFPDLMEAYEKGGVEAGSERIADLISVMALLALPAAVGLALVADPMARTFLSPPYVETARNIIPLGALAGTMVGLKMFVFDQPLHMTKTIWRNIVVTAPILLASLPVSGALASRYGAMGCVVGITLQSMVALAISIAQAHRAIPLVLHLEDLARIGLMCAIMTLSVVMVGILTAGAQWPPAFQLAAALGTGGLSYVAAGWVLMPRPLKELLPRRATKPLQAAVS